MPSFPEAPAKLDAVIRGSKMLNSTDLQNIMHQEWGRRLLVIIGHRHWHHLRLEQAANEYLSKRCCLCDQWVGRAQEMHKHLRLFHSLHWPNVMTKSTQLSNQYANEAPCTFCKCVFKSTHSCNVWTQVALLLLGGAGITESVPTGRSDLVCEICNVAVSSVDEMHRHLAVDHKLTHANWNISRDAKDGEPICAHCSMEFGSLASLRSHIVQGRCSGYDSLLSTEPTPVKEEWKKALCDGNLMTLLKDSKVRLALTLHCQCCTRSYSRAGDLALHLQTSHSELWTMSDQLTFHFVANHYGPMGCVCNPATSLRRLNHICLPWRQLSMQFHRLGSNALFMPQLVTEADLLNIYHEAVPRSLKFHVDSFLSERNISLLWTNEELLRELSSTCVICATDFHPAELSLHMREAHQCSTDFVLFRQNRLMTLMMDQNPTDHQCFACSLIFNAPATSTTDADMLRQRMVQAHYRAQCPVLLQLSVLLCRAAHGGGLGHAGPARSLRPGDGDIPEHGSLF